MNHLILVSQQHFGVLLHILDEIKVIPETEWPEKYYHFKERVNDFVQRNEKKEMIASIIPSDQIKGFLDTIGGYKKATENSLTVKEYKPIKHHLKKNLALLNGLIKAINTQLAEQNFNVK